MNELKAEYRPTYVKIRLDALKKNYLWLKSVSPDFLCPMVKANAYGHGDIQVARALEGWGCQTLGVGLVEEGCRLRSAGIQCTILVFGFQGPQAIQALIENQLTPVVSQMEQLLDLKATLKQRYSIHLKWNTGMNRRGFSLDERSRVLEILAANPMIQVEGLCTHLLAGEDIGLGEAGYSWGQIQRFQKMIQGFSKNKVTTHVYNSSAMVATLKMGRQLDFGCRPGLLTYGVRPTENDFLSPTVSPVMAFHSKIVSTQHVKSGEVVSYGGVWQASRDSLIGILPAGYADGICRSLSNKGFFLVEGQRVPIVGHVCMDYVMVDLTEIKNRKSSFLGEEALFFGGEEAGALSVEDVSRYGQRIPYEILTGISERVPRQYVGEDISL